MFESHYQLQNPAVIGSRGFVFLKDGACQREDIVIKYHLLSLYFQ